MKIQQIIVTIAFLLTTNFVKTNGQVKARAAAAANPFQQCNCQCSSFQFRDSSNTRAGNCASVDETGARWCYVDDFFFSSCSDLLPSRRFPDRYYSYEACATPALDSPFCSIVRNSPGRNSQRSRRVSK